MPPAQKPSWHDAVNKEIERLVSKIKLRDAKRYNPNCITVNLGFYCPLNCAHCFLLPELKKMRPMRREQLATIAKKINDASDINEAEISGGDPFVYFDNLVYLVGMLDKKFININTSGYWAEDPDEIRIKLKKLIATKEAGKVNLSIALDDYHKVPLDNIINIIDVICNDSQLRKRINITLNVSADNLGESNERYRNLVAELSRRNLISVKNADLDTLVLLAAAIPLKIGSVIYFIEIRKGPTDFIGNAANLPSKVQAVHPGGPNLNTDNFSITPDGEISIHPYLMGLISVGNIYSKGSTFAELRIKTFNHPILCLLENAGFSINTVYAYSCMLNLDDDRGELYRKQIVPEAKLRILLEEPLMRYCLTLIALKVMCEYDKVQNPNDFPEIASLESDAFFRRLMEYYREASKSPSFVPLSDFCPEDMDPAVSL